MKWKVPYIDLPAQYKKSKKELMCEFDRIMSEGSFILRDDVEKFERKMAAYLGVKHVVGVNSGTDALYLSVKAIDICKNDEVITVAHTFVATLASIFHAGLKPVLVDIGQDYNMDLDKVEKKIGKKTKAIIPVHLNGRACQMDKLEKIANKHGLVIIEDAAQALGATYKGKKAGAFGIAGCFSLHPMKTLGCAGDGGFVSTDDDEIAEKLRLLRNHGQKTKTEIVSYGYSSRLDNLQAAILNIKIKHLDASISRRREIASIYSDKLSVFPINLPPEPAEGDYFDTFNSYVIRTENQERLFSFLRNKGIEVYIHIPKPLSKHEKLYLRDYHLPVNEEVCKKIISLPVHPDMTDQQVGYVIESIKKFF